MDIFFFREKIKIIEQDTMRAAGRRGQRNLIACPFRVHVSYSVWCVRYPTSSISPPASPALSHPPPPSTSEGERLIVSRSLYFRYLAHPPAKKEIGLNSAPSKITYSRLFLAARIALSLLPFPHCIASSHEDI